MAKCDHINKHPDCPWCNQHGPGQLELFDFQGTWHVRHADGTTENIVLEHGNLVEDAKGSAGQLLLKRVRRAGGGVDDQPRPGDLRFEGMGADSKMFAFLQPWSHAEGSWYEVKLPSPEALQQAIDANIRRAGGVPPGNVGPYTKTTVHPDIKNLFRPRDPEVEASINRVLEQHREHGGWPTCSECGYAGYMVTKLMGHQATAYMCPAEGCGHLTPIPNRGGGYDGPPMGWVMGPARVLPVPLADFSIDNDGNIEPLSERAKEVWKQERRVTWTNLDDEGVASGEAKDIRLTPNLPDGRITMAESIDDLVDRSPAENGESDGEH